MLITATTAILFLVVAITCITIGHYIKRLEFYAFGVLLVFLFSGFIWYNGISEQVGSTITTVGGVATVVDQYDQNRDLWVDFMSVGGMLLGVFLAMNTYMEYNKEKERRRAEDYDAD